jgi:ribosomal protein S18 acetylase RimI-like enzyme
MKLLPMSDTLRGPVRIFTARYEYCCVELMAGILQGTGNIFVLIKDSGEIFGVLQLYGTGSVFHCLPFCSGPAGPDVIAARKLVSGMLAGRKLFCIVGERAGTAFLCSALPPALVPAAPVRNVLMVRRNGFRQPGDQPAAGVVRCSGRDAGLLYPLQAAYEQEEVLPGTSLRFNAAACRLQLERTLRSQLVFAYRIPTGTAEGSRFAAKAGTSVQGSAWARIGGVFTEKESRRKGYAYYVLVQLVTALRAAGKSASLFVKEKNTAARCLYEKAGFTVIGGFDLVYLNPDAPVRG